jgi:hypothetical protein
MPVFFQMHQIITDRLTPESRQTHTPPYTTIGSTVASFAFLASRVASVRFSFISALDGQLNHGAKRTKKKLLY